MKKISTKLFFPFLAVALAFVGGCASNPTTKADFARFSNVEGAVFPPIAIFTTSEDLQYREPRNAYIGALREARVFPSIEIESPFVPIALEAFVEVNSNEGAASGIAKATLFGGTLGLLPLGIEFDVVGRIRVRQGGHIVDEFEFNFTHASNMSLFNVDSPDVGWRGAFRKAAEITLEMLIERGSFDGILLVDPEGGRPVGQPGAEQSGQRT